MIEVKYTRRFIKSYSRLRSDIKSKVRKRVELFRERRNHSLLKVHKLHGVLEGAWSFTIDFSYRVIFEYLNEKVAIMLEVGDHNIYGK